MELFDGNGVKVTVTNKFGEELLGKGGGWRKPSTKTIRKTAVHNPTTKTATKAVKKQ